jgi:hypothetical protein
LGGFFGTTQATENRHEIWNMECRSLYRAGSLETVASGLAKYSLDLVAVKHIRWIEDGSQPAEDYKLPMEIGMIIIS